MTTPDAAMPTHKLLVDVAEDAMLAQATDKPLSTNPHEYGSDWWWYWRLSWLDWQERDERDKSLPVQAERAIEQQHIFERNDRIGVNDLVRRIHRRTDALADWLGKFGRLPSVFLEEPRRLLREAVEELCSVEPEGKP
jgi:hypothetical protein